MLYKAVSKTPLGLTDVEEATSGVMDAVDHIDGCAGEPLSNVKCLFGALIGSERGGVEADEVLGDREPEVLEEAESMGCVPDVAGEFLDQGGENSIK
eukprot:g29786.t1